MKENDIIWVSIEESDKYELSNYGFVFIVINVCSSSNYEHLRQKKSYPQHESWGRPLVCPSRKNSANRSRARSQLLRLMQ